MADYLVSTQDTLHTIAESGFVQNTLFDGLPYLIGFGKELRDSTVVYVEMMQINVEYIRRLKSLGNKVVLYHMADERADLDCSAYPECDLIVRNYYFPHIIDNPAYGGKVMWAPNGWKNGAGPRDIAKLRRSSERSCFAMFAGWLSNAQSYNNERAIFSAVAEKCGPHLFSSATPGFSGGYSVGLYAAMMEDAVFAPCPAGNSPETIRLYDALELGCIPVMLRYPFLASREALGALGAVPFILLESWDELPDWLAATRAHYARDPAALDALQAKCMNWWRDYKRHIHQKVGDRCAALEGPRRGFSLGFLKSKRK